jgi:hypothetical protein
MDYDISYCGTIMTIDHAELSNYLGITNHMIVANRKITSIILFFCDIMLWTLVVVSFTIGGEIMGIVILLTVMVVHMVIMCMLYRGYSNRRRMNHELLSTNDFTRRKAITIMSPNTFHMIKTLYAAQHGRNLVKRQIDPQVIYIRT